MILEKRIDNGAEQSNTITIGIKLSIKLNLKMRVAIANVMIESPTDKE
jgi:hypothetical protein